MMEVVDLHCDLLLYLAMNPERTPLDSQVRCSALQAQIGNLQTQVLAISSETHYTSLSIGLKQLEIFLDLPKSYPEFYSKKNILPAFENASAFSLENESLEAIFKRLSFIFEQITPLYISLTWNGENRFGGGCGSTKGLTNDGKALLEFLDNKGVAIDFSHTSDVLAHDIFTHIDQHSLTIPVMASHSNFRTVHHHIRNLSDEIAKEIIRRKGIIGLVLYRKFLQSPVQLCEMIAYGYELGGDESLAFGADFFFIEDLTTIVGKDGGFFDEMSDVSKYPSILRMIQNEMSLTDEQLKALSHQNATHFIEENVLFF